FHSATMRKPEFATAIKWAQVEFLKIALPTIAAGKDWFGLAWLLERRHGSQFRRADTSVVAWPAVAGRCYLKPRFGRSVELSELGVEQSPQCLIRTKD
ncbi:MAG TPA: hypothetical protein VNH84_13610, partial [Candidatus Saccharimonadales bacterium]|nr:hypothetical protein [Candidatus Saccharimonadales bacterium]